MTFYERYEALCAEHGMKPQAQKMLDIVGITSPSISGWKNGSQPKADVLCRLASFFSVTTDYLLGLSEIRNFTAISIPNEEEQLLLEAYRSASVQGRFNIIQVCMNEKQTKNAKSSQ